VKQIGQEAYLGSAVQTPVQRPAHLPLEEAGKTFVVHADNRVMPNMQAFEDQHYVLVVQTPSQKQAYKDCISAGDAVFYLDDTHQTSGYDLKLVSMRACHACMSSSQWLLAGEPCGHNAVGYHHYSWALHHLQRLYPRCNQLPAHTAASLRLACSNCGCNGWGQDVVGSS